jgi:hypothetical protein
MFLEMIISAPAILLYFEVLEESMGANILFQGLVHRPDECSAGYAYLDC